MLQYNPHIKRLMDFFLSVIGLLFLSPLFLFLCILICLESKGPPFFVQERIGKGMVPFRLIKFRSMTSDWNNSGKEFNPGDSSRITKLGKILRKTKIDELPELLNVLIGDMSIVGPRPEVASYVEAYPRDFAEVLKIRPGLSDLASLKYRDEEMILKSHITPEKYYRDVILPDKLRLARHYSEKISFKTDLRIIGDTLRYILVRA